MAITKVVVYSAGLPAGNSLWNLVSSCTFTDGTTSQGMTQPSMVPLLSASGICGSGMPTGMAPSCLLYTSPRELSSAIRFLAMDAIARVGDGHPGTPLGAADICTALFTRHLKFDPANPRWPDRDRFVQSNGHGSTLIYALLHLAGYDAFPIEQILSLIHI